MRKQLQELRKALAERNIDVWYMGMDDEHMSEYVSERYKAVREFSGFTGSAGSLVISADDAVLYTDGRYFIQAEQELTGSGIRLMRSGVPGVPDIYEYIRSIMPPGGVLGYNGYCVSDAACTRFSEELRCLGISTVSGDIPGSLWKDRPADESSPVFPLEESYTGKSAAEKIKEIRDIMKRSGADVHITASLDDVAWITNLRGDDIPFSPLFMSFLIIDAERTELFADRASLTEPAMRYLEANGIVYAGECADIYEAVSRIKGRNVMIDRRRICHELVRRLPSGSHITDCIQPAALLKRIKNPVEQENIRKAQLKDSAAVTRFIMYFKENIGKERFTEMSLSRRLHEFRAAQDGFIEESFGTISAYGPNAAMCHYSPSDEHDTEVLEKGLYLVDSGGHYREGTTDITRTIVCGPLTDREKTAYTLSVVSNLRLAALRFPQGTNGVCLDLAARKPFWDRGMDYEHGTGHGVGFVLGVHEGPCAFRSRVSPDIPDHNDIRAGIYISDEPGFYSEGEFGVRTENLLLCMNDGRTEGFCTFETVTWVPFDREGIDISLMDDRDIELYNIYHRTVYEKISDLLGEKEKKMLAEMCRNLSKV